MREYEIGTTEEHAFCALEGDTDWVMFLAKAGTTYEIETNRLAAGVDTALVLYRGFKEQRWSGMDIVASNDDREEDNAASAITYTAPSDGSYLVGIANAEGAAGRGHTYSLSITETASPLVAQMSVSPTQAHTRHEIRRRRQRLPEGRGDHRLAAAGRQRAAPGRDGYEQRRRRRRVVPAPR